jgi:hypothetical protein
MEMPCLVFRRLSQTVSSAGFIQRHDIRHKYNARILGRQNSEHQGIRANADLLEEVLAVVRKEIRQDGQRFWINHVQPRKDWEDQAINVL